MDVLMNASRGEGFGIPIIEAQACGTPVIVTDFSAMPELVDWGDWAVPYTDFHFSQNSYQATPSVPEITKRLQYVYDNRDSEEIAQEARNNALKYDADLVTEYYWKPVLDDIAETLERDAARLNQVEIPAAKDV
jgi:glycosyltransferase involved in cell wall biosynthesis